MIEGLTKIKVFGYSHHTYVLDKFFTFSYGNAATPQMGLVFRH